VNDGRSRLVVVGLGDPHVLEGGKRGQDGTTDPHRVLSLRGGNNLDLHGGRGQVGDLLLHALLDAREHGGASGKHDVQVQVLADVHVALHDGLESLVVDTGSLFTNKRGLEERLSTTETLVTDGDDVTVGKLVGAVQLGGLLSQVHLTLEVEGDVGELLLHVTDDLTLSGGGERVTTLGQDGGQVVSDVTASKVKTVDGVGKSVTLIDGDSVGHTITRVKDATSGAAGSIQGKHGLDVDIHGRDVEHLEHDLGHALAVGLGVEGSLSQEHRVLLGGNAQLVVEGVVPDLLHVVPVGHDAVLNRVLQGKDTTLLLGIVSNVGITLVHADHDSGVLGATHDGRKDGSRGVITGKAGLAHTGSVVNDKGCDVFVRHFV